ncbi:MAG: 1-acyl-sn-glycerol-3-phosphate acyltransferase, partial [Acidobacteria bacterium]|nr:1-acyl-sn-glycerol-3-phosphate acyltransferase [Acidobacteriota bacterium]
MVAANHTSHLDMGLVKIALGEQGRDMVALAAADYFFDNKYKRAYMDNFTNLVPIERSGSLRKSLRHARSFLDRGYTALIFPEGTRSVTGVMADFKPVIGFLALTARVATRQPQAAQKETAAEEHRREGRRQDEEIYIPTLIRT